MQRLGLALLALLSLSACTSTHGVSDRYAFWRDNNAPASDSVKPNLADVPAASNTQAAQADMDALSQRLQTDRDNAYSAAAGYPVSDVTPVSDASVAQYAAPVGNNELAPVSAPLPTSSLPAYDPTALAPASQAPIQSAGNVQYNYAPDGQVYVYGNSNAQYGRAQQQAAYQSAYQQEAQSLMAANSNVSINFDALEDGTGSAAGISPVGLTGQPLVFFTHGSSRLGAGDRAKLKEIAQHLKKQPQSVVVVGYASKRTGIKNEIISREANLKMSAKRASAVMRELARNGVKPQQLNVTAQGDTGAGGKATEKQDRRVDILFD